MIHHIRLVSIMVFLKIKIKGEGLFNEG